ncbi:hypothetical protein KEM56_000690 [Ascosphaera pollenicola]|nr:hypothetical protein KEM56_000690 [Ascosphaera pollenicola]
MTQSLICRFQVLQHSHWNGAPTGQGLRIYEILRKPGAIEATKLGLEASMPINGKNLSLYSADWCPSLHNSTGADILNLIQTATPLRMLPLYLDYAFVNNTKYCEHAYILDLDGRGTFEIYVGQEPKSKAHDSHFKQLGSPEDTVPRFLISYPLDCLPPTPEDFLREITAKTAERNSINANLA